MVASHVLITGLIAVVGASMHAETDNLATLLKRQEPGTPAYNCHDNCGTAITISKANDDVCSNEVFLFDYKNCLKCAGPDSYNIWRYYGRPLSPVAAKCGLDTEPLSGEQDEVPKAMHPGESSGGSSSSSSAMSTPTPTASPTTTPEGETITGSTPTTAEANPSEGTSTVEIIPTGTGAVSGSPSAPTNGTGSYTSSTPSQFTGAAAAVQLSNAATFFAFAAMGAAFGLGG